MKVQLDVPEPAVTNFRTEMKWWKWRAEFSLKVLDHPAYGPDSTATVLLDLNDHAVREIFDTGISVEEAYQEFEERMNKYGW